MNRPYRLCKKRLPELVRARRATDSFSPEAIPDGDLEEILLAGLEAPSSYNLQPWRFVVVRDVSQRKKLRVAAMNQKKVEEAPVVVVACGDTLGWREDLARRGWQVSWSAFAFANRIRRPERAAI